MTRKLVFGAQKRMQTRPKPRSKTAGPRHGDDDFNLPVLPGRRPGRSVRLQGVLAEFLRDRLPPLPARVVLHARPWPCLARQVRRSGCVPPEDGHLELASNAFEAVIRLHARSLRATMATSPDGAFA